MRRCLICNMATLSDMDSYIKHKEIYHSTVAQSAPVRTTNRTKREIVNEVENKMKSFLVEPDEKPHELDCRCNVCLNRKLDAILEMQERDALELEG